VDSDSLQVFDWQRIFLGDLPLIFLAEILFRTTWMYVWALLVTRLTGKRAVGDLSSFDYIIVIAIGSSTGDPMFMPDIPLLHGMLVLTVVMLLERLVTTISRHWGRFERVVESTPTPLVRDGTLLEESLARERMTEGELMSMLRLAGVRDLGEVERAWLEPSGQLSLFKRTQEPAPAVRSTWPPRNVEEDPL
jgi:uncharacterized membrane protein YcaP (DUF421 family)